jgi:hypothetical protein
MEFGKGLTQSGFIKGGISSNQKDNNMERLSVSQHSTTSGRSKEETRKMYKKLQTMSQATAAIMSTKLDYSSLKDLTRSTEEVKDIIKEANEEIINDDK